MILSYIQSDAPLMNEAQGGIYAYSALGRQGITRDTYPTAYNGSNYLKPIIVIKARGLLPDNRIFAEDEKVVATTQAVEFWMYQWVGYDVIERMDNHLHRLLHGHKFSGYYPAAWDYTTAQLIDVGSLTGASLVRKDFIFRSIRVAA